MEFGRGAFWNSRNIWRYFPRPGWWGNRFFFFFLKDTKRWRVEENSIIMPDVPNFAKQHFEHFQRSNGHRSTGETLLYQAVPVGKPEFPVVFRTSKQTFKCPTSKILQQRNNSPAENYDNRSTLRPSWSLFHKLRCRKVPMSFLLKVFFHVFPLWGLGLVPDSMSWDSAYCATFAPWALTDGWWDVPEVSPRQMRDNSTWTLF